MIHSQSPARRLRRAGAALAALLLLPASLTITAAQPASAVGARADLQPTPPQSEPPVPVVAVPVKPVGEDNVAKHAMTGTPPVAWPAAGTAEVTVPAAGGGEQQAGDLPVSVAAPEVVPGTTRKSAAGGVGAVRVEVLDRAQAEAAGVPGLLLRVRRSDGQSTTGQVALTVDYSAFRQAYGGDWASRLRLLRIPDCAPADAGSARCRPSALRSRNDVKNGRLRALAEAGAQDATLALAAAPSGGSGDYAATSLAPSGSWDVSLQTGDFSWSYPLAAPDVPGGLQPDLSVSYTSSAVDGRVATTNNQTSWLGEGWNLWPGFVERRYKTCADDTGGGSPSTYDQCWAGQNATMSLSGHSGALVYDEGQRAWRPKDDDGTRVERLTGAPNGDDDGEHWKVTTVDGTQYFFGSRAETQSAWTVPVYGNQPGEPCAAATFAASRCPQAWRWNLDRVVDRHGNTMTYFYTKEDNAYGANLGADKVVYTRAGTLARIEYGTRDGVTKAPAQLVFTPADRCLPGADCAARTKESWPDVPWDLNCEAATCRDQWTPTFWTTKRLSAVTSQVWDGTAYRDVDRWTFTHAYPKPDDGTSPALWLSSVTRTGLAGGQAALPPVTFDGVALPNRVDSTPDGLPPMKKFRLYAVNNESGGQTVVTYSSGECAANALPVPDDNGKRCFPVRWAPQLSGPIDDWFHKYVVANVARIDRTGGAATEYTSYDYEGGAAWAYNDDPFVKAEYRSWTGWRGYEKVRVRQGDPRNPGDAKENATRYQFFRGMNGDRRAGGGTRSASVTDSRGGTLADDPQLAGFLREQTTYNGAGGPVVAHAIHDPLTRLTATQGPLKAHRVLVERTTTRTALAAGGWRETETRTAYDDAGQPVKVNDRGDTSIAADDRCTETTYARDTGAWLLSLPSRVRTYGTACDATPRFPEDGISDVRTYYDGKDLGQVTAGDVTKVEEVKSYENGEPRWVTTSRATHDVYGRVLTAHDALDRATTTVYTPTTGLPRTVVTTNALGHATTTTMHQLLGVAETVVDPNQRRTDLRYDALGRLAAVWLPGRSAAANQSPNTRHTYVVRPDGATYVATESMRANGNHVAAYALYDGFLRPRQTQEPTWGGGRVVTDTHYNARGLVTRANAAYHVAGAAGGALLAPQDDTLIPSQTVTEYDGAGREVLAKLEAFNQKKSETRTEYGGDHVAVTPPSGDTPTATYTDARGQTTELRQYDSDKPSGAYTATRYTYTKAGDLASIRDDDGNEWRFDYDARRRRTGSHDPDKGHTEHAYDAAGRLVSTTDARGRTIAHVYDDLGRRVATRRDGPQGPTLAEWVYDTLAKGRLTSVTRYAGANAYVNAITGYDAGYRITGQSIVIPPAEGGLVGTYTTTSTFLADGSTASVAMPAIGDLRAETLVYTYDSLGALNTVSGAAKYVSKTAYTELGEPTQLHLGDQDQPLIWHSQYYDPATRRLTRSLVEQEKAGALKVDDTTYEYDPAGNVTKIDDALAGAARDVQCFRYDRYRRLTEAWTPPADCAAGPGATGGPAPYWSGFTYDDIGRRLTETRHGLGGAQDTVSRTEYPGAGEARPHAPTSVEVTGPAGNRTDTYEHDAAGNVVGWRSAAGERTLDWDAEGLMTEVSEQGAADGGADRVYAPDGGLLISRDKAGATLHLPGGTLRLDTASGKLTGTRFYRHGDSTMAARTAAGVSYLMADRNGTPELAVNAATWATSKRRFDPFGVPRGAQPPSWPGDRAFVNGAKEAATGLTRLGVRDYDTATGVFLSPDPLLHPGDPQQLAPYAYAGQNPVTFSDPEGLAFRNAPDGECDRGCAYKPGTGPASTLHYRPYAPATGRTANSPDGECSRGCRYKPGRGPASRVTGRAVGLARGKTRNAPDGECYRGCLHKPGRGPASGLTSWQAARLAQQRKTERVQKAMADHGLIEVTNLAKYQSGSVCVESTKGVIVTVGVNACVNWDNQGVTVSGGAKVGVELGAGASVAVVARLSTENAVEVNNGITGSVDVGPELFVGAGGGVKGLSAEVNDKMEVNHSIQASYGVGARASLGGAWLNANVNSGYLLKWTDLGIR
ncbi:RHS repeat-associated core domain-containing protein [Nonomuraea sp. NPDC048892]|uniref:RHS repeat-associated core domain-containing protein n=1 Tax=Nonomuraea sp. NPDC048892 TaxID=3154624 RepID=UPI0033D265FC